MYCSGEREIDNGRQWEGEICNEYAYLGTTLNREGTDELIKE